MTLVLAEMVTETEEQPELVSEGEPVTDKLGLPEGLCEPLVVPLTVTLPETELHDEADRETLALGESVPECEEQPELVGDREAEEDTEAHCDGL